MAIIVSEKTKVLVQGITGEFGGRHTKLSLDYGSQIVAGVTPGKGGQFFEHGAHKVPIFNTVADAAAVHDGAVTDRDLVPHDAREAVLGHVQHREILDVRARADADRVHVAAQHAAVPNARVAPDHDVAHDGSAGGDPRARVDARPAPLVRANQRARIAAREVGSLPVQLAPFRFVGGAAS